jgi:uncharacterized membrane protein YidH (DUF202 family)
MRRAAIEAMDDNKRTFRAWSRTALFLIGGGVAATQLLHLEVSGAGLLIGLPMIVLGTLAEVVGIRRWRSRERALRSRAPVSRSPWAPALLAAGTALIALVSLIVLALAELRP